MKLENAVPLITGANGGLGAELVRQMVLAGSKKIYACARNPNALEEMCNAYPGVVHPVQLDITRTSDIQAAAVKCSEANLLVNNAGVNRSQGFLSAATLEDAIVEIETNYLGTLKMIRAFAPQLKEGDAIINILSVLAKVSLPAMGSLCASKAASLRMTEGVRAELAARGILVMAVLPSAVDTEMSKGLDGPKVAPYDVASAIILALENCQEDLYVGGAAEWIEATLRTDPKSVEKELAKLLPA